MSTRLVSCALVLVAAASLSAQEPPAGQAEAARKRMEYFLGRWKIAGSSRADGKVETFTGTQRCEWLEKARLVICKDDTAAGVAAEEVAILGYDSGAGHYTRFNADLRSGGSGFATGKVQGKVWQWTGIAPSAPKTRFSWTEDSADSMSFKIEMNLKDGFATVGEGKMTRVK